MRQAESQHPNPIICPLVKDCTNIKNICFFLLPISNSEEPEKIFDLYKEKKSELTVEDFSQYVKIMKTFSAKWGISKDVEEIEGRELERFLKSAQMSMDDANKQILLKKKRNARKTKKTFSE